MPRVPAFEDGNSRCRNCSAETTPLCSSPNSYLPSVFAPKEKDFALVLSIGWPCLPATFRRWYNYVCVPVCVCMCMMCNVVWKKYVVYVYDMLCWGHACSGTWMCPILANTSIFRLAKEERWKVWYSLYHMCTVFLLNDSYSLVPSPMAFGSPVDPMAFNPVPVTTTQCPLILSSFLDLQISPIVVFLDLS